MIFVDENARVYQNWTEYKYNNNLPPGLAVAPVNGIYNANPPDLVNVEVFETPCIHINQKVVKALDTGTTVVGFAASAVTIAALATTIAPVVLAGSIVTGIGCAAYSVGRSIVGLVDRSKHEQVCSIIHKNVDFV